MERTVGRFRRFSRFSIGHILGPVPIQEPHREGLQGKPCVNGALV